MSESLPDWLRQRAFATPDRIGLISGEQTLTFAQLDERADAATAWLLELGIERGDHVAVLLPNSLAFVELVHAAPRLGAILVPVNLRLTPGEIAWQLDDVNAACLLTCDPPDELTDRLAHDLPRLNIVEVNPSGIDTCAVTAEPARFVDRHDPGEVHSIVYTSGTTGRPKGALLTYGNHWWSAIGSGLNLGIHTDDRWLAVLPLFHVGGLSILLRSVIYGIAAVVHESFDPATVNRSIRDDRVTIISVVSTMLRRMIQAQGSEPYSEWLRCVLLGGGPAPRPLLEDCAERGIPVTQTYGLTESASQIATLAPDEALAKLGSAGKPLYPNELAISHGDRSAGPGETGEILVRGPIVTAGYHGRPDATEEVLRDGWLHTGDAGFLDEAGYLYVLDRRDDLIVTGGENVYPAEVEAVLSGHPSIVEAGVIGFPDPEWGQAVVAVVRQADGVTVDETELTDWCRRHLAGYKVPRGYHVLRESLPRNAAGKLLRRHLRKHLDAE